MGCIASALCVDRPNLPPIEEPIFNLPTVKLCAPGKGCPNFADVGDRIVVFVDFGANSAPCRLDMQRLQGLPRVQEVAAAAAMPEDDVDHRHHQRRYKHEIMIAGAITELKLVHPADQESKSFKATIRLPPLEGGGYTEGACIPVRLPYCDSATQEYAEVTEAGVENGFKVYFQSIWSQLKAHNEKSMIRSSLTRSSSILNTVGTYGSMAQRTGGRPRDQRDVPDGGGDHVVEVEANQQEEERRRLLIQQPNPPLLATVFVAPLTNVTGLSLHYQLYLMEIFHTRFWTKVGHYLFVPLVILTILAFFAQFRFEGCYCTDDISILIPNGAAVLAAIFFVWYFIWGIIQKTPYMGVFMTVPLFFLYILANIYFQLSVTTTRQIRGIHYNSSERCWNYIELTRYLDFYDGFHLMAWYFNPVVWAAVLSACQALSHLFEPKIPPRVSQTSHWMSCYDMFRKYGCTKALWLFFCQAVFGTIDEFLASPRIYPLLILRVCYTLGYQPKEWAWMKKLVKKCQEYGDPALDYIGTGGSQWLPEGSTITDKKTYIDQLKKEVSSMEHALNDTQRALLDDARRLKRFKEQGRVDAFLEHFIVLRHYVAQYTLQVYAYGPFRTENDENHAVIDNIRMERDFGYSSSFMNFLYQVRFGLWNMEDELIERRKVSRCFECEPGGDDPHA